MIKAISVALTIFITASFSQELFAAGCYSNDHEHDGVKRDKKTES